MRDQIKQELMAQAREEQWGGKKTAPDWTSRFRPFGDIRGRYEGFFFPSGNDATGAFTNFNAINMPLNRNITNIITLFRMSTFATFSG